MRGQVKHMLALPGTEPKGEARIPERAIGGVLRTYDKNAIKQALPAMIKLLFEEGNAKTRASIAGSLGGIKDKRVVPALKRSLFDYDRYVRIRSAESLAGHIGWRKVADLIGRRFPGKTLGEVPAEYFFGHANPDEHHPLQALRHAGDPNVRSLPGLEQKYGKVAFLHRGFPVFIVDNIPNLGAQTGTALGKHLHGAVLIRSDVPGIFREAIAEHEFGETFGHNAGNALEMIWLERKGQLGNFLKKYPSFIEGGGYPAHSYDFRDTYVQDVQNGFKGLGFLKKYLSKN